MRNGMSVEEIRERLDGYDSLAKDYMNLVAAYDDLVNGIGKAAFYIDNVTVMYTNVAASPEATEEDKLEFAGKIAGLKEAKEYLLNVLKECLGSDESEEEENDLPRETEGNESAV